MEFAEWVVSGLDQLRSGQLPAGNELYEAVAAGLGGSPTLEAYMNGGDDAARAALVQAIAQAEAENPAFEQQVRQAAESAQSTENTQSAESAESAESPETPEIAESENTENTEIAESDNTESTDSTPNPEGIAAAVGTGAAEAKPPFFKTTNGMLVLVAAAVAVVGTGLGLGVGLSGDSGSGALAGVLKGTWKCQGFEGNAGSVTIGDGVWSAGAAAGTWKQDGTKVTITDKDNVGDDLAVTGAPTGAGAVDATIGPAKTAAPTQTVHLKGSIAEHKMALTVQAPGAASDASLSITCTK